MQLNNEILINYLDGQLSPEEISQVEMQIQDEPGAASELLYLKLAVDTVKEDAIRSKVAAISKTYKINPATTGNAAPAVIRNMYKISMRVAAVLILFAGLTLIYKYSSVNPQAVYIHQFSTYELANTRSNSIQDAEVNAYRNKNWNEVAALYAADQNKTNKSSFLAAMAEMELKHFPDAIAIFENIMKSGDPAFREESEYYLSLAYLMNHQENKGLQLIHKIRADTSHTFYPLASKISSIDLKIIELKK